MSYMFCVVFLCCRGFLRCQVIHFALCSCYHERFCHSRSFISYVPRRRDANRKAVIAAAGTILIGIVCVIAVFGVNPYATSSSLYDDAENNVIADQANDALKNAGVEVDLENHNDFEKHELEKTFTQAIQEQKADKVVAKRNWEASKSSSSKKSSSSSKSKSSSHSAAHGKHVDQHLESLYDDAENNVIADQANDALKNAGVEVDLENHNDFEKHELEKTFTQAIQEQKADKVVAKRNWEASKSSSSKKSSSSSKSKSSSHSAAHGKHVDQHLESLYDDSENNVIADQANDALKNAGVEVDLENHNDFEKHELEKTFTQAMKEQKAEKIIAKQNWEASKSKSSKKSSSSSSKSKSSSTHHL
jgi:hypothetical protein